jgi:uncharacterized protein
MRICISINDTAQIHFWKNVIKDLKARGHEVFTLARDTPEASQILDEINIPYIPITGNMGLGLRRYLHFPAQIARMYGLLKDKNIDLIAGFGVYNSFVARLLRCSDVTYFDAEPIKYPAFYRYTILASLRLTNVLLTPSCFVEHLGRKHITVDSYKEFAYLHPDHYQPRDDVYDLLGIPHGADFVIMRFNGFEASHDVGSSGFTDDQRVRLVRELGKHAHVFISTECELPEEIKDRILRIPKSRAHDAMYYARLVVTDTSTMATEAALLGTPVVRACSWVKNDFGLMIELEKKYGMLLNFANTDAAVDKAIEMIQRPGLKQEWAAKRERLLKDKFNMADYMVWFLEHYPESIARASSNLYAAPAHAARPSGLAGTTDKTASP